MRLLVIAASGLAVGLLITVARGWQPANGAANKAELAEASRYEKAELAARAAKANSDKKTDMHNNQKSNNVCHPLSEIHLNNQYPCKRPD